MNDPLFPDQADFNFDMPVDEAKPRGGVWRPLSRVMECVIYALLALAVAKLFGPELGRRDKLTAELHRLETVRDTKQAQVDRLLTNHRLLKTDKTFLEAVARDRLDLQRPGEYIVRIHREE